MNTDVIYRSVLKTILNFDRFFSCARNYRIIVIEVGRKNDKIVFDEISEETLKELLRGWY